MGKKDMEVLEARIAEGQAREAAARKKEMKEKLKKKKSGFFADFKKFITKEIIIHINFNIIFKECSSNLTNNIGFSNLPCSVNNQNFVTSRF